ncbi:hypothetical protein GCM10023192_72940 [Amycolatopsis samaneae]
MEPAVEDMRFGEEPCGRVTPSEIEFGGERAELVLKSFGEDGGRLDELGGHRRCYRFVAIGM